MATTMSPGDRIRTLDVTRGVAVMGILAMNIVGMAMPDGAYMSPRAYGGDTGIDLLAWLFNFVFVDGKMRGLFSFLFGASLLLVVERAEAKGEPGGAIHVRRMLWLFVFGLVHMFLIWANDILHHYALIGLIAYLFRNKAPRALVRWAIAFIALSLAFAMLIGFFYLGTAAEAARPDASAGTLAMWGKMAGGVGPLPPAELARELALYRGPYLPIVMDRLSDWALPLNMLFLYGPETLGYMLLGMASLKSGFLAGAWEPARYRRWMLWGYAASIPAYAAMAAILVSSGFAPELVAFIGIACTVPFRPAMIVAHAALIVLLARKGGALAERIGAAGRAAFTNYLGSSIVMTTIFYGYGLGLWGEVGRAGLYLFVIGAWALMLIWSKPWLDRFRYGPLEWLWRTLARGRVQPLRR